MRAVVEWVITPAGIVSHPPQGSVGITPNPQVMSVCGTARKTGLQNYRFCDEYFKLWTDLINELILKADRRKLHGLNRATIPRGADACPHSCRHIRTFQRFRLQNEGLKILK